MKKIITSVFAAIFLISVNAQSEKMIKAMTPMVAGLDTIKSTGGWVAAANQFQRIADAEKTEWLPFYYAALSNVMTGLTIGGGKADKTDPLADKAEALINKAEELQKNNDDIWVVKKMISTLRMQADPMTRWEKFGPVGEQALQKAKSINPQNPRIFLLEGQDKFFTPAEFGGSKTEAKQLFEKSIASFSAVKPASTIHPQWGATQAKYFLSMIK